MNSPPSVGLRVRCRERIAPSRGPADVVFLGLLLALLAAVLVAAPAEGQKSSQPEISLAPPQIQFGTVTTAKTRHTKIRNRGGADLVLGSISLCAGTSPEFSWTPPASPTIAPKASTRLEVTYTPADAGEDTGCLEIASNDPARPTVTLPLRARAQADSDPSSGPDIDLQPDSLDFGEVAIGTAKTLRVKVKNKGVDPLENVILGRCFGTSDEYTWDPIDLFTVPPDESESVEVTYSPVDEGTDEGCLEVQSNDPDESPAVLDVTGTGVESLTGVVDLDIRHFKVKKQFRFGSSSAIFIQLWVRNAGHLDEPRPAVVVGMQNGIVVYEETLMVGDRGGNQGSKKYRFPSFAPTDGGEILWIAMIEDDDPDVDEALAVTQVIGPSSTSVDVDLDTVRLKANREVSLRRARPIRLRLWIQNPGSVDESRTATLVGTQGGIEIYSTTLEVSDPPGDDAATKYSLPTFIPSNLGDILWTVTIDDDDPDIDIMSAVTRVEP